jgi:methyl-accepting chemotaxis protein
MPVENLYEQLKDALQTFKDFLETDEFAILKAALKKLQKFVPQITQMIDKIIELLQDLKAGIEAIDLEIDDLDQTTATQLATEISDMLEAATPFLPDQSNTINSIVNTANVIASIPGLTEVRDDIIELINDIIDRMTDLKPVPAD